jgi:Spy/CpxP family protein refolding chaperone
MKLNRNVGLLVLAIASIGTAAGIASAQSTTTTPAASTSTTTPPAGGHKWHGHRGGFLLGMTLRATRQLNLTADQQASIKQILSTAHAQAKAARASGQASVDMTVLANPGDPNYAAALQNAKTLAANRIQSQSEIQAQIYNVLTAEQKAQLPTILASMKAEAAQRRATWEQKHATGGTDAG